MMVDKIIKFDCTKTKKGVKRIEYFSTRVNLLKNIKRLLEVLPKENLNVIFSAASKQEARKKKNSSIKKMETESANINYS